MGRGGIGVGPVQVGEGRMGPPQVEDHRRRRHQVAQRDAPPREDIQQPYGEDRDQTEEQRLERHEQERESHEERGALLGAGDQGIMFGYATNETENYMPLPISLANALSTRLAKVRKEGQLDYLGPDGKTQVTLEYVDGAVRVSHVVISTQHRAEVSIEQVRADVKKQVALPVLKDLVDDETIYHINPTGVFIIGGPQADTGLTGRKVILDTYGGSARHGGGAFSGKDPSKVDRSAAYAARWVAKNLVAAGLADRCEIQLSYAIGVSEPLSIAIESFGTSERSEADLVRAVRKVFDLSPAGIITALDLKRPIYERTAAYGHFGRDGFSWEQLDRVSELRDAL